MSVAGSRLNEYLDSQLKETTNLRTRKVEFDLDIQTMRDDVVLALHVATEEDITVQITILRRDVIGNILIMYWNDTWEVYTHFVYVAQNRISICF